MRSEKAFTVVWHVDVCVHDKLGHCILFFSCEGEREKNEGREKKGRRTRGEKTIKRGRLGGRAHEGEAFSLLCSKWQVPVVTTTRRRPTPGRASITPRDHPRFRVTLTPGFNLAYTLYSTRPHVQSRARDVV